MRLSGKSALVTGGASGLGLETARHFAREGCRVVIADLNLQAARDHAGALGREGLAVEALHLDVRDEASVQAAVAACHASSGAIDVLVNSAGIAWASAFADTTVEAMRSMYQVNVRGTFLVAQAVARSMVGRGGAIINLASVSGRTGNAGRTAYGATKAAVELLTQVMAVELAQHGIRVNAIAPGPIETPLAATAHSQAIRDQWLLAVPAGRYGLPREIAEAAVFLAAAESAFVTGHTLVVDGGFMACGLLRFS